MNSNWREEEGNESTDDNGSIEDVPQVSTVRARMKEHTKINDLLHAYNSLAIRNKKHLKNVGPIRHCKPPHAAVLHYHSPGVATVTCRLHYSYSYRCPQQQRRQQRQRVTEGTAMAPWNGPNKQQLAAWLRCVIDRRIESHYHQLISFITTAAKIQPNTQTPLVWTSIIWVYNMQKYLHVSAWFSFLSSVRQ